MSDNTLRRANWDMPAHEPISRRVPAGDPLAELERLVGRGGDPFAEPARPVETAPPRLPPLAPATARDPFDDFDVDAFEAALRGSPQAASPEPIDYGLRLPQAPVAANDPEADARAYMAESEPNYDPQAHLDPVPPAAVPSPSRGFMGFGPGATTVAAVLGLVVVGAAGAVGFATLTGGVRSSGEPVVVAADNRPMRVQPDPATQAQGGPDQNKLIYDRLGGTPTGNERVVPREEQPVAGLGQGIQTGGRDMRVVMPTGPAPRSDSANGTPEPRRVQTTTIRVRSDGSIEQEPAARAAPVDPPAPIAALPQQPVPTAVPAPAPAASPPPPVAAIRNVPQPAPPPQREAARPPQPAPAPAPRPQVAAPPPEARPVALVPTNAPAPAQRVQSGGGFVVQIASARSDSEARSTFAALQRRFPDVLSGRTANIRAVELDGRGTFHRVRVGPLASRDDATALCQRLRQAGGDCVVALN